ncbi:NUDIX domain-containing protein [Zhihengliuella sp.]|uniref:NUDIX hydrolase n=1 Tax=Zhihengliuella sp. TaxID=1954483 RepID=UPI002811D375|nr:NUDIX domain-containing protein [Zhihengliuella sp.]
MSPIISVSAVSLLDDQGRVLLVRKRGTARFMQPGGKPEPGEAPAEAAVREVREELGLSFRTDDLVAHGLWVGAAANEPGTELRAHLFEARLADAGAAGPIAAAEVTAQAEIAELLWVRPEDALDRADLAPLLREEVLPRLLRGREDAGAA